MKVFPIEFHSDQEGLKEIRSFIEYLDDESNLCEIEESIRSSAEECGVLRNGFLDDAAHVASLNGYDDLSIFIKNLK